MEKMELAKKCLNAFFISTKNEELYPFLTKDTVFYDIENGGNISLGEMVIILKKYQDFLISWLESPVSIKAFFKKDNQEFHLYFDIKHNRVTRLEFASHI